VFCLPYTTASGRLSLSTEVAASSVDASAACGAGDANGANSRRMVTSSSLQSAFKTSSVNRNACFHHNERTPLSCANG